MFHSLPHVFREHKLQADIRTLLLLRRAIDKGLVCTFGDLFVVLKGIVVKSPEDIGPFSKAYYDYFLNVQFAPGERFDNAIARSIGFKQWQEQYLEDHPDKSDDDLENFINRYLDEVHLTSYDIKKFIDGQEIFNQDNPDIADDPNDNEAQNKNTKEHKLDQAADYSNLSLEELLDRMRRVAAQQKSAHEGGSHWIGQGGISPYGSGGAAQGGIRVGGAGGGKMARKVIGDQRFFPVDLNRQLNDDNIDATLASLKGVIESSAQTELDIPATLDTGLKRGGLFLPELKDVISENMKVILLIDNGGYSMQPYVDVITKLFKKMKTRFAHDLKTFYFHNTIYDQVFTDARRRNPITIDRFLAHDSDYRVFVIGDAAMAPYELGRTSIAQWQSIRKKYKKMVWLNPDNEKWWSHTLTTQVLGEIVPMFPMTPKGIENAVISMNKIHESKK